MRGKTKLECPVKKVMEIIGKKWTILIVYNLISGLKRFKELEKSLDQICPRMLSERLKELEKLKLIEKKISSTWPLKITYRLTKKGNSFYKIIKAMEECGEKI
jgi:DNA-binding HxlR family transcriptional regulator